MAALLNPILVEFENGECKRPHPPVLDSQSSWVYVWVADNSKLVVYVGETSQTLVKRLRCSIGELKHNTLGQLQNNASITGLDINQALLVYAYPFSHEQHAAARSLKRLRRSAEAWVHWFVCVRVRKHHAQYCGFKYNLPDLSGKKYAESVVNDLASRCGWKNVSL